MPGWWNRRTNPQSHKDPQNHPICLVSLVHPTIHILSNSLCGYFIYLQLGHRHHITPISLFHQTNGSHCLVSFPCFSGQHLLLPLKVTIPNNVHSQLLSSTWSSWAYWWSLPIFLTSVAFQLRSVEHLQVVYGAASVIMKHLPLLKE